MIPYDTPSGVVTVNTSSSTRFYSRFAFAVLYRADSVGGFGRDRSLHRGPIKVGYRSHVTQHVVHNKRYTTYPAVEESPQ